MSRGIVESELFRAQCNGISPDVRRMDDILDALYWALYENAEQFFRVLPDRNLWLAKTDPFPGSPALRIWFSLTPDLAELLSIERTDILPDQGRPRRRPSRPRARRVPKK
jgi:hypothetical protein